MATTDRYHTPDDLPRELPLFPLRGAILLPRATLPLNVFEPRYLQMVEDVMSGKRLIGIIQPDVPPESGVPATIESPKGNDSPLKRVGCAGRVTTYQELDDGRILVTLTGIARFSLTTEHATGNPYRTASVAWHGFEGDFSSGLGEDKVDREALLRVLKRYLEANRMQADWPIILKSSTEFLVNALAVMSPYGAEEKQALLEAPDLKSRAEVLVALAEMDMAAGNRTPGGGMIQ
ncbi:MAG: LON peptidase substrate-binding domain-containing protein [Hyphomicrobiaceae bacterium]|nr:LON peptidase substrate-binding domain-containing protein [Hyphomicrobiaceae bacterium]